MYLSLLQDFQYGDLGGKLNCSDGLIVYTPYLLFINEHCSEYAQDGSWFMCCRGVVNEIIIRIIAAMFLIYSIACGCVSVVGTQQTVAGGDTNMTRRTDQDASKHQQAANALLKVKHKLQGYEQNSQLSVSGQVNYLIQQATDPTNLAKLFHGWQPFL